MIECASVGERQRRRANRLMQVVASLLNMIASIIVCCAKLFLRVPANLVFVVGLRNTKPWNHHMCTIVLWTKIVVDFMFL